ncbi:MAG: hypothetical protein AB7K68_05255 [Bacteriovoracia bacterium]
MEADDWVLGPAALKEVAVSLGYQAIAWPELRLLASCYAEDFREFSDFNDAAIKILEMDASAWEGGISIPRALSYRFISPHGEDLPYFISGIRNFLQKNPIVSLNLAGRGYFCELLLAASAGTAGTRVPVSPASIISALPLIALEECAKIYGDVKRALRHFSRRFVHISRRDLSSFRGGVIFGMGKERVYHYARPTMRALEKKGTKAIALQPFFSVRLAPEVVNLEDLLAEFPLKRDYFSLHGKLARLWRAKRTLIQALTHEYEGVNIAKFHAAAMREIWFDEAAIAALTARYIDRAISKIAPVAFVFTDPLELPYISADTARRLKIPAFYDQQIMDGYNSSATLVENHIRGMGDFYAALTPWFIDRWEAKGIAKRSSSLNAGSVLFERVFDEKSKQAAEKSVRQKLGLDPQKPIFLFLSRAVSFTLGWEDKKWILRECEAAAKTCGAQMVIKGHPFEDRALLEDQARRYCVGAKVVIGEVPLDLLCAAADVVVGTPGSTANLEVNFTRTPLAIGGSETAFAAFDMEGGRFAYQRYKSGVCVVTGGDLGQEIGRLHGDPVYREKWIAHGQKFAERVVGQLDGKANERLAEFILKNIR